MRLTLDHHYSPAIAIRLRAGGHDVVAALERGWHADSDLALLEACAAEQRALLTNNVADFMVLARRWQSEGREHAGLVLTSDGRFPRTTAAMTPLVDALHHLLVGHPDGLVGRVHWLTRTG